MTDGALPNQLATPDGELFERHQAIDKPRQLTDGRPMSDVTLNEMLILLGDIVQRLKAVEE